MRPGEYIECDPAALQPKPAEPKAIRAVFCIGPMNVWAQAAQQLALGLETIGKAAAAVWPWSQAARRLEAVAVDLERLADAIDALKLRIRKLEDAMPRRVR